MKRAIDIHSHILPGVDDGCGSKEEALRMIRMYEAQNAEAVICTPHFGPCGRKGADVEGVFKWLREQGSSIRFCLGNEILHGGMILEDVRRGNARRMAGSTWILIEFDEWGDYHTSAEDIAEGMRRAAESEFRPILAHAERYACLWKQPELYHEIVKNGAKIQINAYDICENSNRETVRASRYLLEHRLVTFLGSDAHGAERRSPKLETGVRWIYDNCPEEYADAIVHDNAAEMIVMAENTTEQKAENKQGREQNEDLL